MTPSKRVQRLIRQEKTKQREQEDRAQVAIGYVRVSTQEQARKGYGLRTQAKAIRAFAESQGYELLTVIQDAGVSGATPPENREGFRQVLEWGADGVFSILLLWKIDRLARSIVHAVVTANALREDHGVVLRSVTEPIDLSSAMGQTLFSILAGMAQQERQAITERTLLGRKAKAEKGGYAGAAAPFGYRSDGAGNLVIEEVEAVIVRRIFAARGEGQTLAQIADALNAEGVPTRRRGRWHPGTVRYLLDNPRYRGQQEYLFRWAGDEAPVIRRGQHEPIIAP